MVKNNRAGIQINDCRLAAVGNVGPPVFADEFRPQLVHQRFPARRILRTACKTRLRRLRNAANRNDPECHRIITFCRFGGGFQSVQRGGRLIVQLGGNGYAVRFTLCISFHAVNDFLHVRFGGIRIEFHGQFDGRILLQIQQFGADFLSGFFRVGAGPDKFAYVNAGNFLPGFVDFPRSLLNAGTNIVKGRGGFLVSLHDGGGVVHRQPPAKSVYCFRRKAVCLRQLFRLRNQRLDGISHLLERSDQLAVFIPQFMACLC